MIVFELQCDRRHRFEGWFDNSQAYRTQNETGLLVCPECGIERHPQGTDVPRGADERRS